MLHIGDPLVEFLVTTAVPFVMCRRPVVDVLNPRDWLNSYPVHQQKDYAFQ